MYTLSRLSFVITVFVITFSSLVSLGQSINAVWGKSTIASTDFIKTDPSGNVYRTSFQDSLLVKINTDGNVLWSIPFPVQPEGSPAIVKGLAVDGDGNAYVVGSFKSGTITLGSTILNASTTYGLRSLFLVKYNPNGTQAWAITDAVDSRAEVAGMDATEDGDFFISGKLNGSITTFGTTSIDDSLFHVKYNTDGDVVWVRGIYSVGVFMAGVTVDADGNSIVTGNYTGSVCVSGGTTLNNSGSTSDMFIFKYSPSGIVVWGKSEGTASDDDWVRTIDADINGNIIIAGTHQVNSLFIKKIDASGNEVWENFSYNASCTYIASKVCTDQNGNVYLAGFFIGPELVIVSTKLQTISSGNQLFVASFNTNGNLRWAGLAADCIGEQLESDNNGHVYLTGNMNGPNLPLGSVVLANANTPNGNSRFLAKLNGDNSTTPIFVSDKQQQLSAFPNPTNASVLVSGLKEGQWNLEVYGINGRMIYSTTFTGTQVEADLSAQPKGLYVVKLRSDNNALLTGKIIVE